MKGERLVTIHEGAPPEAERSNGGRWIRLVVRKTPLDDDKEAESLFKEFVRALEQSQYADEFVLSIHRIGSEEEPSFGVLPKIENEFGCEGIGRVRRYLSMYAQDIKVPLVI